jgi:hypothetical protein
MLFIRTKGILRPTQQMRLSLAAMTLSREASDGPLAKGTLLYTSSKTSNANTKLFLDSSFHNVGAKLPESAYKA